MEDTLLKVLNIPIATSGNPLGEYTHINNIIGPAIGVGGTIYNLVTLKSTNFHHSISEREEKEQRSTAVKCMRRRLRVSRVCFYSTTKT